MKYTKERIYRFKQSVDLPRYKPYFQDYHLLSVDDNFEYPAHEHTVYEIIVVVNDRYFCTLNQTELAVSKGKILVIQPGDIHQDHFKKGQRHYVLHFQLLDEHSPERFQTQLFGSNTPLQDRIINPGQWNVYSFFNWMEEQVELNKLNKEIFTVSFIQDCLIELFFWQMVSLIPLESLSEEFIETSKQKQFQAKLLKLFNEHKSEQLSVEQMASYLFISKRSLTLLCKKYIGESPAKAFLRLRLQSAAGDLQQHEISIQEISCRYGFDNQFQFSRAFKRLFKISPSEYKSKA